MIDDINYVDTKPVFIQNTLNKVIKSILCHSRVVEVTFTDGSGFTFDDRDRQCCEERSISTDDDLQKLVGKRFLHISCNRIGSKQEEDSDYPSSRYLNTHDIAFVEIMTDDGWATFSSHNIHNGCYEGFKLTVELKK